MMNPRELHCLLEGDILSVARYLLPAGKQRGREWVAGSVNGEEGESLSLRVAGDKIGVWCDFATGEKGDLLDLWKQVRGTTFVETLGEVKGYLGLKDPPIFKQSKRRLPEKPPCQPPGARMTSWFEGRGITAATIKKLKVAQQGNAIVFPSFSPGGELELVKYREMDQKRFWSNKEPIPCLFGWQAVDADHRDIVICEGEIDAMSFWQQDIPALSVPMGAGSGAKQDWIEYEFDRLERFDEIYICMDSDQAGQAAVVEIIDRLGRHRCKVVDLTHEGRMYKDANEVLLGGISLELFLRSARTIDPEELRRLAEFHDEIMAEFDPEGPQAAGLKLPWPKTFDSIRLRPSEVTVLAGINGHGKSALLSHVMIDGVSQGSRWCIASMEMPPSKLGAQTYRQAGGVNPPTAEYASKIRELIDDNIFVFNVYGTAKATRILEVFEYARRRYGITHYAIDSLAKCGFPEDDYSSQKDFVDQLYEFALKNGVHVLLVVHVRKAESEEKVPGKFDIKGTGAIADMVSNVLLVWRNKVKERLMRSENEADHVKGRSQCDTVLACVKQRATGEEPSFGLWYHPTSCQFLEREGVSPKQYITHLSEFDYRSRE